METVPELFRRLPRNVIAIFSAHNLWWHASAIILTIIIVMSGGDWAYFRWTRGNAFYLFARPGIRLGTFLPVLACLGILIAGEATRNRRLIMTAWALGQAALLGYLISCCYKAFTGRLPPPFFRHLTNPVVDGAPWIDSSHGFQFGFLKGGVFWGWPSSHTAVAFAMSVCLVTLHPKNKMLVFLALLYAFYIGLGVSVTIHWLSEFVAGAIIGSVIGMTVGRSFKREF